MRRRLITITGLGGLSLACGGSLSPPCGPLAVEGNPCVISRQCTIPGQAHDCGLNGYACEDGRWEGMYTYCNPPPQPAVVDCEDTREGDECADGDTCEVAEPEDCGIIGYHCIEGAWSAERMVCNPPPPPLPAPEP